MSEGLQVLCGQANANGVRVVVATLGPLSHRDKIDCDNSFARSKFREACITRFSLDDSAHEYLEQCIIQAADAEDSRTDNGHTPDIIRLSDVTPEQISWLWPGKFALGKLGLVVGDPGLGKSFFTIDLAARVSCGTKWPDCEESAPLGSVVLLGCEDGLSDTVRPRLDAAGADVSKIIALRAVKSTDTAGDYSRPVELQRDLDIVRRAVDSVGDCRLLVVDPISAFMGSIDSHSNTEVRGVLQPLGELAEQTGIAVIAVSHLKKGESSAIYRTMGSLGFIAAARTAWAIVRDKRDKERRLFLPLKNNVGSDHSGLAFNLTARYGTGLPVVCWDAEPVTQSVDEAMAPERQRPGPDADEQAAAEDFLRAALADGPRPTREVEADAKQGHGISQRTLERARKSLKVVSFRESVPGVWKLRLPTPPTTPPNTPGTEKHGGLGGLGNIQGKKGKVASAYAREANTATFSLCEEEAGVVDHDEPFIPDYDF